MKNSALTGTQSRNRETKMIQWDIVVPYGHLLISIRKLLESENKGSLIEKKNKDFIVYNRFMCLLLDIRRFDSVLWLSFVDVTMHGIVIIEKIRRTYIICGPRRGCPFNMFL